MYDIGNKRNAIKEVQRYLLKISDNHISQNGAYDENTRNAVADFQEQMGLNRSGAVDRETFELLYKEYLDAEMNFGVVLPILPGDYGEHVRDINKKIGAILDYYGIFHSLRSSPYYSDETKICVEKIRQIYLLDEFNGIDKKLYSRIICDFNKLS